jgi:hypothetical protein
MAILRILKLKGSSSLMEQKVGTRTVAIRQPHAYL